MLRFFVLHTSYFVLFVHYRTQGLIIKKEDKGEFNQLFTIYTKDFGKLEILGKAIRKITSKLRASADIFYLSEIEFIQTKSRKTLTDAILIEKFDNLRKSLKKLAIAYKITEVLDNLVRGQEPDEKIWLLLNETFDKLNVRYKLFYTIYKIYYYFLWNLLSLLGYTPELYNCVICQKNLSTYFAKKYGLDRAQKILCSGLVPEKLYFSPEEGGVICYKCSKNLKLRKEIVPEVIKILRFILKKDWSTLGRIKIEPSLQKSLKSVSESYLSHIASEINNISNNT